MCVRIAVDAQLAEWRGDALSATDRADDRSFMRIGSRRRDRQPIFIHNLNGVIAQLAISFGIRELASHRAPSGRRCFCGFKAEKLGGEGWASTSCEPRPDARFMEPLAVGVRDHECVRGREAAAAPSDGTPNALLIAPSHQ